MYFFVSSGIQEQILKEINFNKAIPTSSQPNLSRPTEESQVNSYSLENGAILDQTTCSNKQLNTVSVQEVSSDDKDKSSRQKSINTIVTQGSMSSDVPKKLSRQKKYLYCCFLY